MVKAVVRLVLLGLGLMLGWWWPKAPEPGKKEPIATKDRGSILGPLNVSAARSEKAPSAIASVPIPAEHELVTISGLIQVMDDMHALGEEGLLQQLEQWHQRLGPSESISAILCHAYAGALLADGYPKTLQRALAGKQLDDDNEILSNLLFQRWVPEDEELEGLDEWPDQILLGIAKRDPERAWRQVLTEEATYNEIWTALAERWHANGNGFLKRKLAELSSEDQRQGLLVNWGLALAHRSPDRAIALLEELEMTDDAREDYVENVVSTWARKDLPATLDYLVGLEDGLAAAVIPRSLSSLPETDALTTSDWAVNHLEGAVLEASLEGLLPTLAKSNLNRAQDLLTKISSPEKAALTADRITVALREVDPIAAYEFQASANVAELPASDRRYETDFDSIAGAVASVDFDYAYQAMVGATTFAEERGWADALAMHLADLPHKTAEAWLQNVQDDTWRRRLSWIVADRYARY